jgi:hypothetical protein
VKESPKTAGSTEYPPGGDAVDKLRETNESGGGETGDSSSEMAAGNNGRFLEAEKYVRAGVPTDAEHAGANAGESIRQSRLFRQWAEKAGRIIPPRDFERLRKVSQHTSEHVIYYDEAANRAIKHTHPGQFGWVPKLDNDRWTLGISQPLDYLKRWRLFNEVFGDDVRLEGVTLLTGPAMIIGASPDPVAAVVSQRWHEALDSSHAEPDEQEVAEFMIRIGFKDLPKSYHGWYRFADGIIVLDARPDNFIKTPNGIAPIDLLLTQIDDNTP